MARWLGVLLFLFIPFTLFLFVYAPISLGLSLAAGVVLMFGHRFLARPYMRANIARRCLWCGRDVAAGEPIRAGDRSGPLVFRGCNAICRDRALTFVAYAAHRRRLLVAGIGNPLGVHVVTGFLAAAGVPVLDPGLRLAIFRGVIAVTVLSTVILFRTEPLPVDPPRFPFPIHNVFLLGIRTTLVVFAVVGTLWIVQTVRLIVS